MSRYIITGGGGFIGRSLALCLEQCGHETVVASRGIHRAPEGEWIEYDLQRPETIANLTALQADGVFHLAWSTVPGSADQAPGADVRTNVAGSLELFRELARAGTRTVFLSSGGTVYGRTDASPIPETHAVKPLGIYGMGKLAVEEYADLLRRTAGFDVRIARVSNPYGTNNSDSKAQGAASIFARRIMMNEEIMIMGDGSVIRDYIDVDDAARAICLLMTAEIESEPNGNVFNIGSGEGLSLSRMVSLLEDLTGETARIRRAVGRPFDVPTNVLDIAKITAATDWRPSVDIHTGLRRLVGRLRDQNEL